MKKERSLAGISSRNKKEIVQTSPLPKSVSPEEEKVKPESSPAIESIVAATKTKKGRPMDKEKRKPEEDREVKRELESEYKTPLPDVDVPVSVAEVKKALYGILNHIDILYFSIIKNTNICFKKMEVDRSCLLECQHYGYCRGRSSARELIKKL